MSVAVETPEQISRELTAYCEAVLGNKLKLSADKTHMCGGCYGLVFSRGNIRKRRKNSWLQD